MSAAESASTFVHAVLPWLSLLVAAPLGWAWRLSLRVAKLESEAVHFHEFGAEHKRWTADVSNKVDRLTEAVARIEGRLDVAAARTYP